MTTYEKLFLAWAILAFLAWLYDYCLSPMARVMRRLRRMKKEARE